MRRTLQLVLVGVWTMALAGTAAALPGDDDPPEPPVEEEEPPPPPPPPPNFSYVAQKNGSIGNSTVGANYQAALQVWTDANRQSFMARGYAHANGTLLGMTKNLVIINGMVNAGTSLGTEISTYLLGQQVFSYKDSFSTSFNKTFTAVDYRTNFWSYQRSWTFMGTGVSIRLAVDGGTQMSGNASGAPLRASGTLNPRAWVDAGGTLSFHLLWITAGSLTGTVRVIDAQASGTATVDATALPYGGPTTWSISGWANLCSLGGTLSACIPGKCGVLVTWNPVCPGWLWISGSASGSI